ncbi:MAG TPA: signal peptide peptidase SppA [Thermodesulfobacteriota bacterium]|nr:signal peptide peptidase SppA [Thermodesulfobacteriota bacterium]
MKNAFVVIGVLVLLFFAFLAGIGSGMLISGDDGFSAGDRVAVLKIDDVIIDDQDYIDSLDKIKEDKKVKALVVRIDSPGGAVGPSQEIYSELKKLRSDMPVIASIGNVGASGGYYIACAAEKIFANPGSITGSIGVVAEFASYEKLLEWAKVDVEVLKSGKYKDVGSPYREMSPEEREYMQGLIDNVYSQFKSAVAESRGLGAAEVDKIADGKIYTGEQAKRLKLVDNMGTINDAVSLAAEKAGIKGKPDLVYYPKKKSQLLELLDSKVHIPALTGRPSKFSFGLFYLVDIIN